MPNPLLTLGAAITLTTLLTACATPGGQPIAAAATPIVEQTPTPPEEIVLPFEEDTLFRLLVAEFAGSRGDMPSALANYQWVAEQTRDRAIVERATRMALYMRRWQDAEQLLALWREVDRDNVTPGQYQQELWATTGQWQKALAQIQPLWPQDDYQSLLQLVAYMESRPAPELKALLEQLPDQPETVNLLLSRALLQAQLKQTEPAIDTTRKLLALDKQHERGHSLLVQLLAASDQRDLAIEAVQRGLAARPDSRMLNLQYVRLLLRDDLAGARTRLQMLTETYPDDAEIVYSLAALNMEMGNFVDAKAGFARVITQPVRRGDAHFQLAAMAVREGETDVARDHLQQVRSGRYFLVAMVQLAEMLVEDDGFTAAQRLFERLRREYPDRHIELYQAESELLMRHRQTAEARNVLNSGLDLYPDQIDLLYARSLASEQLGDFSQTEQDLRAILAVDKNNSAALNALGYSLLNNTTRYQEGYELIQSALDLAPGDPSILDSLGWAYYRLGDLDKALAILHKVYQQVKDPEIAAHLGEVLWEAGDGETAKMVWLQAQRENPNNAVLNATISRYLGVGE